MKKLIFLFCAITFLSCQPTSSTSTQAKIPSLDTSKSLTTIAFGSCNKQNEPQPIWNSVIQNQPNLWIWLGDNIYGDTDDMTVMKQKYDQQFQNENYQKLVKSTPVIGTWDDHDYGRNDAGKEYPHKKASKNLMLDFLNVPKNAPVRKREGAYQTYTFGTKQKVKVILLDARYFRDHVEKDNTGESRYIKNETGDILGEAQWSWLEKELSDQTVDLFLVGSGIQMIPEDHRFEKWANFPTARKRLLDLIETKQPNGIILLSGDRHISEISKIELSNLSYPVYDVTSSGLTHSYEKFTTDAEPNRHRVENKATGQRNFGILKIDWSAQPLKVSAQIRGLDNVLHFEEEIVFK